MFSLLKDNIDSFKHLNVFPIERKAILKPLIDYINEKINSKKPVNLNFICTHNSRRSHLSQIWAQVFAKKFNIPNVHCYSGGTEETSLFPQIVETLMNQGFNIYKLSDNDNPVYAIKYSENELPIIAFSKKHDSSFNPSSDFAAIMTCTQADLGCPYIPRADKRISIPYVDPKISDGTINQAEVYFESSKEIALEMMYVFSHITK